MVNEVYAKYGKRFCIFYLKNRGANFLINMKENGFFGLPYCLPEPNKERIERRLKCTK